MHIAIPYSLHASVIFPSWTLPPGCATYCEYVNRSIGWKDGRMVDGEKGRTRGTGMQIWRSFVRSFVHRRKELLSLSIGWSTVGHRIEDRRGTERKKEKGREKGREK
jgi:hypothetical protein